MFTWSENPQKDVFKHLEILSYQDNSRRLIKGEFFKDETPLYELNETLEKSKALQISMCIKQGIEYFKAAEVTTLNTSPLLLYYGILALSKALIIANDKDLYIDSMKYHGLSTRPINDDLKKLRDDVNNWSLENEYAIVNDGVFKHLNKVISPNNLIENKTIFNIKDCLSCIPELKEFYIKYFKQCNNTIDVYMDLEEKNSKVQFALSRENEAEYFCYKNPLILQNFEQSIIHTYNTFFISKNNMNLQDIDFMYYYRGTVGGRYFILKTPVKNYNNCDDNILVNQMLLDYIMLFILSNLVRYHQDLWNKSINGKESGFIALINMYISIVIRRFPNMILNHIFRETFDYGTPARFS